MNVRRLPHDNVTGLHAKATYHPDFAAVARNRIAISRASSGLSPAEFAHALGDLLGRHVEARHILSWEANATPPGDVLLAATTLSPTSGCRLGVRSHKFVAAHIGHDAVAALRTQLNAEEVVGYLGKTVCWTATIDDVADRALLTIWPWGTVIIHLVNELDVAHVAALALWRYQSYPDNLAWASEKLQILTGRPDIAAAYVLSLYWVHGVPWVGHTLDAGLRLICAPRALVDQELTDMAASQVIAERAEQELLAAGYHPPEMRGFGVPGVSSGWASWSGVVYHPHDPLRALLEADMVAFEIGMQAIWAYTSWLNEQFESGTSPDVHERYGNTFLRSVRSLLLTPRPQETGQYRQMRDAIVATSQLADQLGLAMDALKEAGI